MGVHTEVERLRTVVVPYTLSDTTSRPVKRNVGRFEVKHEMTDGRENVGAKKSIRKTVGIEIKRTEAAGKQRAMIRPFRVDQVITG